MSNVPHINQIPRAPKNPKPIIVIGAGGIVNDAHLPAYKKAGFDVIGIFDIHYENAKKTAEKWGIKTTFATLEDAAAHVDADTVIFDVAVPPVAVTETLKKLPDGATVMIQKPMGEDYQEALQIREICRSKNFTSAINFNLRFSPQMMAIKGLIDGGHLGELLELEMTVNINTPWHLFTYVETMERVEVSMHSIHYMDLMRYFTGRNPNSVFSRTMGDQRRPKVAQTRTSTILDYGHTIRCTISVNHNHLYDSQFQLGRLRIEGDKGAVTARIGSIMDYPDGVEDDLWFAEQGGSWHSIPLEGAWFPEAFLGSMSNLQCYATGETDTLINCTEDAIQTMALVEACFIANESDGIKLPDF